MKLTLANIAIKILQSREFRSTGKYTDGEAESIKQIYGLTDKQFLLLESLLFAAINIKTSEVL